MEIMINIWRVTVCVLGARLVSVVTNLDSPAASEVRCYIYTRHLFFGPVATDLNSKLFNERCIALLTTVLMVLPIRSYCEPLAKVIDVVSFSSNFV